MIASRQNDCGIRQVRMVAWSLGSQEPGRLRREARFDP